jgi:putative membrane-bound dehydrogenase-like protein
MLPAAAFESQRSLISRILAGLALLGAGWASVASADEALGVRVPDGFEVSLYADDELAHDIYSMTVDAFGRVVVSGAGYVRILVDADNDGKAESFKEYAAEPKSGAQGMYFHGRDLICLGDEGLQRYADANGDDKADGAPQLFVKLNSGGEHDAHAIRKGPDGWWYLICGNMAGVNEKYNTLPNAPVKSPRAGTLMRFTPDLSKGEVIAHGLRNAYDFDFNALGDIYTFDSDGEREITLPWYEPTRLYQLVPGADCGWFSKSYKRPEYFLDMPPVLASFGRSSPTGLVTYRHTQFPAEYQGALFALDWTYGRIWALPMVADGSTWTTQPIEFMTAVGEHGFAPTDAEVGPDGSLFVCVGGRGTRGAVYRIRKASNEPAAPPAVASTVDEKLTQCLTAPQPLSSWSRLRWEPLAKELKAPAIIEAALDASRSPAERVRAIEILTEKFRGLDADMLALLTASNEPAVRARAAWSLGRTTPATPNAAYLKSCLETKHPLVVRMALEALEGADDAVLRDLSQPIALQLGSGDRLIRQTAVRLLTRSSVETYHAISQEAIKHGWQSGISVAVAFNQRRGKYHNYPVEMATRILKRDHSEALKLEAARLLQLSLGDMMPDEDSVPEAFLGYTSRWELTFNLPEITALNATYPEFYPSGSELVDLEIERSMALSQPTDPMLLNKVLTHLTPESHPVADIHRLLVTSKFKVQPSPTQQKAIAEALIRIEDKIKLRKLPQDSDWDERITEMYSALVKQDPAIPDALLQNPDFGRPGHVIFVGEFQEEQYPRLAAAFLYQIQTNPNYQWTNDVVFLLGSSLEQPVRDLVRAQFNNFALRNAVLMSLAEVPSPEDRDKFIAGLESSPLDVMAECVKALLRLPASDSGLENVVLLRAFRKLSPVDQERQVRDQLEELLRRNLGQNFGYQAGQEGNTQAAIVEQWTAYVQQTFPTEFARQAGDTQQGIEELKQTLATVDWTHGNAAQGEKLFHQRACVQCHSSRRALGPDLQGAATRFSREDLFTAIVLPNRDVSPRYQTTLVETKDGRIFTGMVVYEAIDGVVIRNAANQTFRIDVTDIETRKPLSNSLMPGGLLKDLGPSDYADLYAYLRTLTVTTAQAVDDHRKTE